MLRRRLNRGRDPQPADSPEFKMRIPEFKMRIPESLGILGTPGIPHTWKLRQKFRERFFMTSINRVKYTFWTINQLAKIERKNTLRGWGVSFALACTSNCTSQPGGFQDMQMEIKVKLDNIWQCGKLLCILLQVACSILFGSALSLKYWFTIEFQYWALWNIFGKSNHVVWSLILFGASLGNF
jgi:hypothetical protein